MSPDTSANHFPWLDGWRGLAISLVLIEHFAGGSTGRLGVDVFFVLSGFLITRILFEQRVSLATFYRRRLARIFPVFYLYVGMMTFVGWMLLPSVNWGDVGSAAVFMRSYFGEHIWNDPLAFGNLWSLNVEEHAYVLLSLLAVIASKRSERIARWLLTLMLLVPLAAHAYFHLFPQAPGGTPFQLRTESAIFPLLMSSAIFLWARVYRVTLRPWHVIGLLALTVAVAAIDTIGVSRGGTIVKYLLLPGLLALSVNVLHLAPKLVRDALSVSWLRWLGMCSFSIYLWHYPFFVLINRGVWPYGKVIACICALAVGAISFYFFERPMRELIRGSKSRTLGAVTAPAT
jgi:peptidoglycan/LPS O-acetylase OafA/YrhL